MEQARDDAGRAAAQREKVQRASLDQKLADEVAANGGSLLHLAAMRGDSDALAALLRDGADPTERDNAGDTAMHVAARLRHVDVLTALLPVSPWAAVNKVGRSPVDEALLTPMASGAASKPALLDDPTAKLMREAIAEESRQPPSGKGYQPDRVWAARRALEEGASSSALDELMGMTGLRSVKLRALELFNEVRLDLERPPEARSKRALNLSFVGNPGAGKTTVARIFGKLLSELGVRDKDAEFVELTGQDALSAGSGKFKATLKSATPGTLFLDEVYQLDPKGNGDGRAITNMIMRAAEEDRDKLSIIVAGYADDVRDKWMASNDGLPSRFPIEVMFEDFSEGELRSIFLGMVRARKWTLESVRRPTAGGGGSGTVRVDIASIAARRLAAGAGRKGFGNARSVRVVLDNAIGRANSRMMALRAAQPLGAARSAEGNTVLTVADVLGAPIDADSSPAVQELMALPGLAGVKRSILQLLDLARDNFTREAAGLPALEVSLHRLFLGPPGTGKTTIAKVYGRVLRELGMLSNGDVIIIGASKLVGDVVGSAQKAVNEKLDSARGKVLVIDEAYVLNDSTFGKDALNTLVERVQPGSGEDLAVIMCGYEEQMREMFRVQNPGLARRFKLDDALRFESYGDAELAQIMCGMARKQGLSLAPDVSLAAVKAVLSKQRDKPNFGNAGAAQSLLDTAKQRMGDRRRRDGLSPLDMTLAEEDFFDRVDTGDAMRALDSLVNAEHIRAEVRTLQTLIRAQQAKGFNDRAKLLHHWRFIGPPGTGKTTAARAFAEVYRGLGLLSSDAVVEVRGRDLMGSYVGQTAPKLTAKMEEALGGVLFIDEAYGLVGSGYSNDAVETLLGNITDRRFEGKLVVILAGYEAQIGELLDSNPGMRRRFTKELTFLDWKPRDCLGLFNSLCAREGIPVPDELGVDIERGFEALSARDGWGNAGDAVTVQRLASGRRDVRCLSMPLSDSIEGPLLPEDVRGAFDELLRQRPTPRRQWVASSGAEAAAGLATGTPPAQMAPQPPPPATRTALAVVEAVAEAAEEEEAAELQEEAQPPSLAALMASLEQATQTLGYDLRRVLDITTSRALPGELVALVASKLPGPAPPVDRVRAMLLDQCGPLSAKVAAAIAEEEAEAARVAAALAAIAAAAEAEREALAQAERERQMRRVRLCVYCGRPYCNYMPRDFVVDPDGPRQVIALIGGGTAAL